MTPWPPRTKEDLRTWMDESMPGLRGRREVLIERLDDIDRRSKLAVDEMLQEFPDLLQRYEWLAEALEKAETLAHQPVVARYSQVQAARTQHSDPTYSVVLTWLVKTPWLRDEMSELEKDARQQILAPKAEMERELGEINTMLNQYEGAKGAIKTPRQKRIIEARYEQRVPRPEIAEAEGIALRTYDAERQAALAAMFLVLEWYQGDDCAISAR